MPTDAKLESELFELEKKFWQAMKDRDVATAVALTDFPCVVSGPQGASEVDEPTFTKMMKSEHHKLDAFELGSDPKVRLVRDDVAVLAYKAHEALTVDGERIELDVADSSTWIRRDGQWRCAQHSEAVSGDPFGRDRTPA
jgi:hypothetical protein